MDERLMRLPMSWRLLLGGAMLLYGGGFVLWYSTTPLGLYPVLDGREMLDLARRIAGGELAREPFYRAPLYPALLALPLTLGLDPQHLPLVARLLNLVLHATSAACVWHIARATWRSDGAAAVAFVLFAVNPVALHFVGDPLDTTLGMSFMLAGLACMTPAAGAGASRLVLASLLFALAGLTRPQLLTLIPALWLFVLWQVPRTAARAAAATVPALLLFGAMGAVSLAWCGEFRVLPAQGAFNLWAANHGGANGRYFEQRERLAVYADDTNPARIEAARAYRRANPEGPFDSASTEGWWRARLAADIAAAPSAWLSLLAAKLFYLANDFEQYNNKTYHVHKQRSPWLAPNPIGWAVIVIAAAFALGAGARGHDLRLLWLCAGAYAAGLLLTYVSARFRLPLVPLAAIVAGGVARRPPAPVRAGIVAVLVALVTLWPLPQAARERTVVQDYLLIARAATESGDYAAALSAAAAALERVPGHEAALELACVARFNAWLYRAPGAAAATPDPAPDCVPAAASSPVARRIAGTLWWRRGETTRGIHALQELAARDGPEHDAALAALVMVGAARIETVAFADMADVLVVALAARGDARAQAEAGRRFAPAELERQLEAFRRLYVR